eukprot:TRINITY_DN4370_c0_g1_i3.p1 TRINITY_DN4370_c0_g1~~TRINITY_DN4370_c0_g1_i3.p1  ORF type:complete len:1330 (+),score=167.43 TRINITY_DN4370_c0_g1_i3:102-4091(+)
MCDVFGPPVHTRPFQQYQVYKKRTAILVFGIDKVRREYSLLRIPKQEDLNAELELLDGEKRLPLENLEADLKDLSRADPSLEKINTGSGIVGFIRFLQGYYLILITQHKMVGKIGHHNIHAVEKTEFIHLFTESAKLFRDERALRDQLNSLNLSKDFYFSHTYELSRTVQQNLADAIRSIKTNDTRRALLFENNHEKDHRFVWNYFHMRPFLRKEGWQHWCISMIHGFFQYTKCSSFGWAFEIGLVARRSRFYAGTRYRKRGLNVDGQVANFVEAEQIVCDDSTRLFSNGNVLSFTQVRGSVPLLWSQEANAITPKPRVVYPRCDPTLSATRFHFKGLLECYGTPQVVVNLMRAKKVDSVSSEVRLKINFEYGIEAMNRELPPALRIIWRPFDMKSIAKSSQIYDVFARMAESVVAKTGFFHSRNGTNGPPERQQSGCVRTNCVDCLDRTNALQFFVGLEALKQQLAALNLLPEPRLDFNSPVVSVLSELYDLMGDHLALQYAGSVAHKKFQLLGSRPRMITSSKELITSIHRHYHNSFTDIEKQASLNLFLGVYKPREHPRLWEVDCDLWLHHKPLKDDYEPGNWWEKPLMIYANKMAPLSDTLKPSLNWPSCSESMSTVNTDCESGEVSVGYSKGPISVNQPQQEWFREIHSVWKLTCFEKLLKNLPSTQVHINTSSQRRLNTLRPFRTFTQRGELTKPSVSLASYECRPRDVDVSDNDVYKTYLDSRHLSRFMWLGDAYTAGGSAASPSLHLADALLVLSRPEEPALPLSDVFRNLIGSALAAAGVEQIEGDRGGTERPFMRWLAQSYLSPFVHRERERSRQRSEKRSGLASSLSRASSPRGPAPSTKAPLRPAPLHLCSYCDAPFDASSLHEEQQLLPARKHHIEQDGSRQRSTSLDFHPGSRRTTNATDKSAGGKNIANATRPSSRATISDLLIVSSGSGALSGGGSGGETKANAFGVKSMPLSSVAAPATPAASTTPPPVYAARTHTLCCRHRRRADALEKIVLSSGFDLLNPSGAGTGATEGTPGQVCRGIVVTPPRVSEKRAKLWEGWLTGAAVNEAVSRSPSRHYYNSGPTTRAPSRQSASAWETTSASSQISSARRIPEHGRSSIISSVSGIGGSVAGTIVSNTSLNAHSVSGNCNASALTDGLSGARSVGGGGGGKGASVFSASVDGLANPPEQAWKRARLRHFWSFAFPHEAPAAPQVEELGLPDWWLQTLDQQAPPLDWAAQTFTASRPQSRDDQSFRSKNTKTPVKRVASPDRKAQKDHTQRDHVQKCHQTSRSIFFGVGPRQITETLQEIASMEAEVGAFATSFYKNASRGTTL